jgi:D-alanyl-D-alanine carboxypeptidase
MKNLLLSLFLLPGLVLAQSFPSSLSLRLQQQVDSFRLANNLKGISVSIHHPGMGTWKGVSGISHPGTPIRSDMVFGIASNTKLFTAVLMLKLAEKNIIRLSDSLHRFLPTFNNINRDITIRQLLNHTSGLDDVTSVPGYPDSILTNPNRIFTPAELMTWAGPPLFTPGTGWNYCNTNYLLAGMIAEAATGKPYGELLRDSILTPLNMDSTFLDVYDSILFPVAQPWQAGVNNHSIPRKSLNSAAWAAGAMYSTADEMVHWYRSLMGGAVLGPVAFQEMTTFVGSGNYGMGIGETQIENRTVWQHGGTIWGGYNSSMMYDTATGMVICVLLNQLPNPAKAYLLAGRLLSEAVDFTTSLPEKKQAVNRLVLHPVPAGDCIEAMLPGSEIRQLFLYRPDGRLLKESADSRLSLSGLPAGLYVIRASTEKGWYLERFVKE